MTGSTPALPPTVAALADAARHALRAPSIFNSQPWRWRVGADTLELSAEHGRLLDVTDPEGRLLLISCGAALHHALVALGAAGLRVMVTRSAAGAGPLASIRVVGRREPSAEETRLLAAIPRRRTDRRAFGDTPVPAAVLDRIRAAAETNGAHLHVVRADQMPMLAIATAEAAAAELADPAYRAELGRWTHRPAASGDGVPAATAVRQEPRRVPVRDYAPGGAPGLQVGAGTDRGATYAVLFGDEDTPDAWLRGGEALSAVLLTAVAEGLATAPLSDAVEQAWPRRLLRDLLAGVGEPYLVVRLGIAVDADELPPSPRRDPDQVIVLTADARDGAAPGTADRPLGTDRTHRGGGS